jgi:predicted transcriptional regulator
MLVFCGMGQALLNQVLEIIRISKLPPIPLKAVLTDTNRSWTTAQLYEELLKERETIAAQKAETT